MHKRNLYFPFSGLTLALFMLLSCGIFQNANLSPTPPPVPPPPSDFSGAHLTLEDLPPGFIQISIGEFGISTEDFNLDSFTLDNLDIFVHPEKLEFVLGFTTDPLSTIQLVAFDIAMQTPEILLDPLVTALGATEILEQNEIPGLNTIGETSFGYSLLVNMNAVPTGLDLVIFKRGTIGAGVMNLYIAGSAASVNIETLAQILDARIVEALTP